MKVYLEKMSKTLDKLKFESDARKIYQKYRSYTMIDEGAFIQNLSLVEKWQKMEGAVVECGVWRGGMSAGMAELLGPNRHYFLFDSFEGLPPAKEIDGPGANAWQTNTQSPMYFNNCTAEMDFAVKAMKMATNGKLDNVKIIKGWFKDTLVPINLPEKICILRLDADWYDSTKECLSSLFNLVIDGGLILFDDYYTWDGCSRAVHDFLSDQKRTERIYQWPNSNLAYLKKFAG
jgi:O-methyltransferase